MRKFTLIILGVFVFLKANAQFENPEIEAVTRDSENSSNSIHWEFSDSLLVKSIINIEGEMLSTDTFSVFTSFIFLDDKTLTVRKYETIGMGTVSTVYSKGFVEGLIAVTVGFGSEMEEYPIVTNP